MASEGGNNGDDRDRPATAHSATADSPAAPKLRRIEITNYKAIDHLVLDIPAPVMPNDPDIFVVGSKNGVGKTSLLECCALAHLSRRTPRVILVDEEFKTGIRSGSPGYAIVSTYVPSGLSTVEVRERDPKEFLPTGDRYKSGLKDHEIESLFGRSLDPLLGENLLLFHSHRKVAEGPLRLQQMLNPQEAPGSSTLKLAILGMLMAKSGLLEDFAVPEATSRLEQFNQLLSTFAGGRIDKLRTISSERLDIRIATPNGATFSFDALSSGQKEILSTLFLIWDRTTRNGPALVLIDEPELHLNAEWQREFIHQLQELAPQNQYILATHSEEIFASVSEDRRVLLDPQG